MIGEVTMIHLDSQRVLQESRLVMVVEDDRQLSALLERGLSDEGYRTTRARDGKDALEILQREAIVPSLILLDLMMPRMGGLQFLERLRRDDTFADVPVILMSGHAALTHSVSCANLRFFPKPFGLEELLAEVRTTAGRSSSRWAAQSIGASKMSA